MKIGQNFWFLSSVFSQCRLILPNNMYATIFFSYLKLNNTLRELHLCKCDMRDFGAKRLSEALECNKTLQVLDLSV